MAKDHCGQDPGLGFSIVCIMEAKKKKKKRQSCVVDPVAKAERGGLYDQERLMDYVKCLSYLSHPTPCIEGEDITQLNFVCVYIIGTYVFNINFVK